MLRRRRIRTELASNPQWQVTIGGKQWLCPLCAKVGASWTEDAKQLVAEVSHHLEQVCDGGEEPYSLPALQGRALDIQLSQRIANKPNWGIVDSRNAWYCPSCALPTSVQLESKSAIPLGTLGKIKAHLGSCEHYARKELAPLKTLLTARALIDLEEYRFYTPTRHWMCPFCLKKAEAQVTADSAITNAFVKEVQEHLDRCYLYKERAGTPKPLAEVKQAHENHSRSVGLTRKISRSLLEDPVWQVSDKAQVWVCPYCRLGIPGVKLSSAIVIRETCPHQIAHHLLVNCKAYQAGATPAKSIEELRAREAAEDAALAASLAGPPEYEDMDSGAFRVISKDLENMRAKSDEMDKSLEAARKRQLQMLPELPEIEGFQFAATFRPCSSVGGDFYDFVKVSEHQIGVTIGDVTGHGMEAAIVMSMAKKLISICGRGRDSAAETMHIANEDIRQDLSKDTFVSVAYGVLDTRSLEFTICSAGHNPWILYNPARTPKIAQLNPKGTALGLLDPTRFNKLLEEMSIQLQPGDTLIQYTDGITEAMDKQGEEFEVQRLVDLLEAKARNHEPEYLCYLINSAVEQFTGGAPPDDDLTLLIFQVS